MPNVTNELMYSAILEIQGNVRELKGDMKEVKSTLIDHGEAIQGLAQHMDERFDEMATKVELNALERRLTHVIRKEDVRVDDVIEKLHEKNVFTDQDVRDLRSASAFSR